MDVNNIIQHSSIKAHTLQDTLPKLYNQNSKPNSITGKRLDTQKDALLALKRDPAILDAKLATEKQDASNSQEGPLSPMKPKDIQAQPSHRSDFENKMCMEQASLFSLSSAQFTLLLKYVDTLRMQRMSVQKRMECVFCKNNRQPEVWYTTHTLKDRKGRVKCPVLRSFTCPQCGATGNNAHTIKHCPHRN